MELKPTPEGRRRCEKGHLTRKGYNTFCGTCWNQIHMEKYYRTYRRTWDKSPACKAAYKRYGQSKKGKARNILWYTRQVMMGFSCYEIRKIIVPGNEALTRERLLKHRIVQNASSKRWQARWGRPNKNFVHAFRRDQIKEGYWKEEEHPL